MITLDEALQDCQNQTSDTTLDSQAKFLTWLNQGYQNLIATFGRPGIEKTTNTTTNLIVLGSTLTDINRSYGLPPDYLFMKTIKVFIGNRWYQLQEEESQELWNYRIAYAYGGIPSLYFINENFGVGSAELQIDPICTVSSVTGTLYTPTVATVTNAVLSLTFAAAPIWSVGQGITLAGFSTQSGINLNQAWTVASVIGNTLTVVIPTELATDTVTIIGTVGTTIGVPMQMVYESSDVRLDHLGIGPAPLFGSPTAANVTFTYGSNVVTSNTPVFSNWMGLGSTYITPGNDGDGNWYKIVNVNNTSTATIGNYYQNTTVTSNASWSINQIMSLHVDMQDIPEDWALWKYYKYKKDAKWRDYYANSYATRLNMAKNNWATKSRSAIIRSKTGVSRWHNYPGYFPAVGVSS